MNHKPSIYSISFSFIVCLFAFVAASKTYASDSTKAFIAKPTYIGANTTNTNTSEVQPLDSFVANSEVIVVGEVTSDNFPKIQIGQSNELSYQFTECVITISQVLKGNKNIKSVSLAMPALITVGSGWQKWEGPIFQKGTTGIWFLTKDPRTVPEFIVKSAQQKGDYYFAESVESHKEANEELLNQILSATH